MPERWDDVDRVWHAVLARPESERSAAIAELCADDPVLRREVESLLGHLARASAAGFGVGAIAVRYAREPWIGRTFGPYSVHTLLGAGGMGEVFQARDSILEREVALKILPDLWLADPERNARFDREARVLASLNVIKGEPDLSLLAVDTPASLRVCLRRCLERDPAKRLHHVADVRLALAGGFESAPASGVHTRQTMPLVARAALAGWAVAALVVLVATVTITMLLRHGPVTPESSVDAPATPPVLVRPKRGGGGEAMTKTIQEAIDLAVRGATVSVLPGTYPERLIIKRGLIASSRRRAQWRGRRGASWHTRHYD